MMQRSITSHKNIESSILGKIQQFAVFQAGPAHVCSGESLVLEKMFAQAVRKIFVEQHFHRANWCF